ncbi:MAG: hypothetical protein GX264_04255, partial [Clostridiales bacterium]|nr:hypothetical protein [Clostridiales bacterium]
LSEDEILKLAKKRRKKFIRTNYSFKPENCHPDKHFKSSMKPSGKLYSADIELKKFPSYASNLLKGKKHEWVLLALVQEDRVKSFYANKGLDNSSVSFNCDIEDIIRICKENNYQTIMRFHNHPNSDPQHYTALLASRQDKRSARYCSEKVLDYGINWLDFVCERGRFIEFYRAFSESFSPSVQILLISSRRIGMRKITINCTESWDS